MVGTGQTNLHAVLEIKILKKKKFLRELYIINIINIQSLQIVL